MPINSTTEERLAALERTVAEIQQRLAVSSSPRGWLDKVIGSIDDAEAFEEALAIGRAYRQSVPPPSESEDPP